MRTVFLDGKFVPEAKAKLSIYDLSVMQAAAAFEMTRSFNGVHFKLREHLERLVCSCHRLGLALPDRKPIAVYQDEVWVDDTIRLCEEVTRLNDHGPGEEHRLLIVVSPGCAPMYKDLDGVIPHPFLYIADFPLRYTVKGFSKYFTEGVHCVTSDVQQVPDACLPSSAKHRSRLHFHLAQMRAPAGTWPILLDTDRDEPAYTEAPGANLVYVEDGCVNLATYGSLPGISLQTVQELTVARGDMTLYEYGRSFIDELWLTGTPFCMLPVVSLDGKPIGNGKPGPIFKQTLAKWSEMVGVDIQKQIEVWDEV